MHYDDLIKKLFAMGGDHNVKLGLERIYLLLEKLNHPESSLKYIHVAGTNGKGSTCAMISSILKAAGYNVGMYTSPHLVDFRERFQINGKNISKEDLVATYESIQPFLTDQSYFEIITTMAFVYFKNQKVDVVVLEVGLGGRLDATNVIPPGIVAITNIGLEHTKTLGNSIEKIAREKAGIVKSGCTVFTTTEGVAYQTIAKICKDQHVPCIKPKTSAIQPALLGVHQKINAGLAIAAANAFDAKLTDAAIQRGLAKVQWLGRLQWLSKDFLIDATHNAHGAHVLATYLKTLKRKCIIVFGACDDKNVKEMLSLITPFASHVIFTKANIYRAIDPKALLPFVPDAIVEPDVVQAIKKAEQLRGGDEFILFTGSMYLIGEWMVRRNFKYQLLFHRTR
ncbi:bifunctional folylpolyglutamate synthase/dihydrofolate synthase [Candidatus Woesearchaeota archaeon]|nr:bifunctional folylpolyglutamate synthase/dihydrofolate synthase [Candidatus Woesearchaeota archaeon]